MSGRRDLFFFRRSRIENKCTRLSVEKVLETRKINVEMLAYNYFPNTDVYIVSRNYYY